jgi:hypothetical protein
MPRTGSTGDRHRRVTTGAASTHPGHPDQPPGRAQTLVIRRDTGWERVFRMSPRGGLDAIADRSCNAQQLELL